MQNGTGSLHRRYRNAPFGALCRDELRTIEDLAGSVDSSLALASKGLWRILQRRKRHVHRRYRITDANVDGLLVAITEAGVSLEGTSFNIPIFTRWIQERVSDLYASYIQALTITGRDHRAVPPGEPLPIAEGLQGTMEGALVGLEGAEHLRTLRLNFDWFSPRLRIGPTTLRPLKDAPALEVLHLGLEGNALEANDMVALALAVNEAPHIRELSIGLRYNKIGIDGARALGTLKHSQTLESLDICLSSAEVDPECLEALVTFGVLGCRQLHTLALSLDDNNLDGTHLVGTHLAKLQHAPLLHTLHLNLGQNDVGFAGITALTSGLMHAPVLGTLHIDLSSSNVGSCAGAWVLNRCLGQSPVLHTFTLSLADTDLGDAGVTALAELGTATPAVQSLCLRLGRNRRITNAGIGALSTMSNATATALHTLELDLSENSIDTAGLQMLAVLKENPRLHTLRLHLRSMRTPIDDDGIFGLMDPMTALGFGPLGLFPTTPLSIETLELNLSNNKMTTNGIVGLSISLDPIRLPLLSHLHLDLSHMIYGLDDECAASILVDAPTLKVQTLHLDMSRNRIGDRGAVALGRLSRAPLMHRLRLNLNYNNIGDAGAWGLVALADSPALRTLHLDLGYNYLSKRGVRALANFQNTGTLRSLFLNVEGNLHLSTRECDWALNGLINNQSNLHFEFKCGQVQTDTRYTDGGTWVQRRWRYQA
jgi:hypothetical protein